MPDDMKATETTIQTIYNCARCGNDHENLEFVRFQRPIEDRDGRTWEWWATCPVNGDPVLMHAEQTSHGFFSEEEH